MSKERLAADRSVEEIAERITYGGKHQDEVKQLCEGSPWVGEDFENIKFAIISALTAERKKIAALEAEVAQLKKDNTTLCGIDNQKDRDFVLRTSQEFEKMQSHLASFQELLKYATHLGHRNAGNHCQWVNAAGRICQCGLTQVLAKIDGGRK